MLSLPAPGVCVCVCVCVSGTHSYELVGVIHHGDQHVQQNHQRDDVVRSKHGGSYELCELVASLHVGDVQVQQAEHGPEERLQGLKQPGGGRGEERRRGGVKRRGGVERRDRKSTRLNSSH